MTFEEVNLACKGYEIRMARIKEMPRLIATVLINANRKPHTPAISLQDVSTLYTDKERKVKIQTREEYEDTLKLFGRRLPTKEDKDRLCRKT